MNKMAKTIWKYELKVTDSQRTEMPTGAKVLSVQVQFEKPCLWAMVDPERIMEHRTFRIYGTGHIIDINSNNLQFIGTFQVSGGGYVFHLFEQTS